MKLKLLTLLVTLGLFAFGVDVNATDKKEIDTESITHPGAKKAAEYVKANLGGKLSTLELACEALKVMNAPCDPCTTLEELEACVAKDPSFAHPIGEFCHGTCGKYTCYSDTVAEVCQAMCCAWDSTDSEVVRCFETAPKYSCPKK